MINVVLIISEVIISYFSLVLIYKKYKNRKKIKKSKNDMYMVSSQQCYHVFWI